MNRLIQSGKTVFSVGVIGLGILCIVSKDFIVGRPPAWPATFKLNPLLSYISGAALIVAAMAIIFNIKARVATLLIAGMILLLSVLRHLPHFMENYGWLNGCKSIALFGGTLIIASMFFNVDRNSSLNSNEKLRKIFVLTGCVTLAAFFIESGYAHFKFPDFVNNFIPAYIPFHPFWTYFCGICLLAGGIGLLIPQTRRLAAFLSGIMIAGWFILLHVPRFFSNMKDASDRMGLCESFTFVGILFVLAGLLAAKEKSSAEI